MKHQLYEQQRGDAEGYRQGHAGREELDQFGRRLVVPSFTELAPQQDNDAATTKFMAAKCRVSVTTCNTVINHRGAARKLLSGISLSSFARLKAQQVGDESLAFRIVAGEGRHFISQFLGHVKDQPQPFFVLVRQ